LPEIRDRISDRLVAAVLFRQPRDIIHPFERTNHDVTVDIEVKPVDAWAKKQDDQPGRTEAIRRLVEIGLKGKK